MKIICTKCSTILGEWHKPEMTEQDLVEAKEMFKCHCEPDQDTVELIEEQL